MSARIERSQPVRGGTVPARGGTVPARGGTTPPHLTRLELNILQAITDHISQNEEVSLTELADECHAAKSTVVKAVQKMGYQGFTELTHNARFNAQTSSTSLLPRRVTVGDVAAEADLLAGCFARCHGGRNWIFSGDRRCGELLASYMSRKLAMFDIFAPTSYDYAMTVPRDLPCGVAFFCFHRELPGKDHLGQREGYGEGMLAAARRAGFYTVAFSDAVRQPAGREVDLLFKIAPNDDSGADLYATRVIILFEQALSLYAKMRRVSRGSHGKR